jgi:PKD repeat protein
VRRALGVAGTALAVIAVLVPASASAQVPAASFSYSPASPLSGQTVMFTSTATGTITSLAWDLDGNGACDDATGASAARAFPSGGAYGVTLCVNGDASLQKQTIVVRNRPPVASFSFAPLAPMIHDTVMLTSTSADPDGPIAAQAWDIDGDGQYDDGGAVVANITFGRIGVHTVGLRVVDRDGASALSRRTIAVGTPPVGLLSPFPVVRLIGSFGRSVLRVDRLAVRAPGEARVRLTCRGRGCPYRRKTVSPKKGIVRFRRLERHLRPGRSGSTRASASGEGTRPGGSTHAWCPAARSRGPAQTPEAQPDQAPLRRTTSLPTFAPSNSRLMASGSCSKPSTTVSSGFSLPSAISAEISATASGA